MAVKLYLHDIDLDNNQLLNARMHPLSTAERVALGQTLTESSAGRLVYDKDIKQVYVWDGEKWILPFRDHYTHIQTAALASWTIEHFLGKYPSVSIVDSANDEVYGEVNHIDINTLTVSFSAPFSGKAFLN